jgi:hypothetical protein
MATSSQKACVAAPRGLHHLGLVHPEAVPDPGLPYAELAIGRPAAQS